MFDRLNHRAAHYAALAAAWAVLCLPNLGGPGLWDIDEGNNAEAAREMLASGNWVVPTFNYKLREDKPALLYWLQMAGYELLGVNETAARLPSALAALVTALATYELGRRLFGATAGVIGAGVLVTSVGLLGAAHFANPDALLVAFTTLALALWWHDFATGGRGWPVGVGAACGLGVLAKGPIGVLLPVAVILLFLLWQRRLRWLLDVRLFGLWLAFALVAVPWYALVATETKGAWLRGFLQRHHADRVTTALEGHGGPVFYYVLVLLAGLGPWAIFAAPAAWQAWRAARQADDTTARAAVRFLAAWFLVVFVTFSLVRTKLPNYILPCYPAAALLIGHFLDRWRRGEAAVPAWLLRVGLACLALAGVAVAGGMVVASGAVEVRAMRGRAYPELLAWAWLGAVLLAGAAAALALHRRGRRGAMIAAVAATAGLFLAPVAAWGVEAVEAHKAPRALAAMLPADHLRREVRVAAWGYFQPSLVFYCRREVARPANVDEAAALLAGPLPAYLFVPEGLWPALREKAAAREVGRRRDLYTGKVIVVVTNEGR